MDQEQIFTLLQRIQAGNESAIIALHQHYKTVVYSVAFQILSNQEDAEEVTQDVFMRIWDKAELFDAGKGRFITWLLTITRHLAIDRLRSRQRRRQPNKTISLDEREYLWEQVLVYEDLSDLQRTLLSALDELPDAQREAILLAYFRGMTHVEIAEKLARPLGTVKSHIRQGMQQLRSIWMAADTTEQADESK